MRKVIAFIVFFSSISLDAQYENRIIEFETEIGGVTPNSMVLYNSNLYVSILHFDDNSNIVSSIAEINSQLELLDIFYLDSFAMARIGLNIVENDLIVFGKNRSIADQLIHGKFSMTNWNFERTELFTSSEFNFPYSQVDLNGAYYLSYADDFNDGSIRREGLMKINEGGEIVWRNTYNESIERSQPWQMIVSSDDHLLVSSGIHYFDAFGRYVQLKKIDVEGEIVWSSEGERVRSGSPVWVADLSSGNIVQSYEVDRNLHPDYLVNDWNDKPTVLLWYDSEGSEIHNQTINFPRKDLLHYSNIEEGSGDYFYGYGNYQKGIEGDDQYYGILTKYTNEGAVLWSHRYQHLSFEGTNALHNITDIIEMDNGDIVTLGTVQPFGGRSEIWMMRLNKQGCLGAENCEEIVVTDILETENQNVKLSPNPTNGIIMIDGENSHNILEVQVIDLNGRLLSIIKPVERMIDLSNLASGMYTIRMKLSDDSYITDQIILTD